MVDKIISPYPTRASLREKRKREAEQERLKLSSSNLNNNKLKNDLEKNTDKESLTYDKTITKETINRTFIQGNNNLGKSSSIDKGDNIPSPQNPFLVAKKKNTVESKNNVESYVPVISKENFKEKEEKTSSIQLPDLSDEDVADTDDKNIEKTEVIELPDVYSDKEYRNITETLVKDNKVDSSNVNTVDDFSSIIKNGDIPKRSSLKKNKTKNQVDSSNVNTVDDFSSIIKNGDIPKRSSLKKNKTKTYIIVLSLLLLAIIGVVAGFFIIHNINNRVIVPTAIDVSEGLDDEMICQEFTDLDLNCSVTWEVSETEPIFSLISQSIPADEVVKKNSYIELTYSLGEKFIEVPNLSGVTVEEAKEEIISSGLTYGGAVEVDSDSVSEGTVIETSIKPGILVLNGTSVFIKVSTGSFIMPDFLGMTKEEAEVEAENLNLVIEFSEEESSEAPGIVLSQSPKAKERTKDTVVKLTLSKSKEVVELTMPDVVGMTEEEAQIKLFLEGFQEIQIINVTTNEVSKSTITDTDPSAGSKISSNTKVVLVNSIPES